MFSPGPYARNCKIFGPAYTVKVVPASDKNAPTPEKHIADMITQGSVVFISQPKEYMCGVWGGLMTVRAQKLGAVGVVIDGRFRDIHEQWDAGMPLFARDIGILGSAGYTRSSAVNVPLTVEIAEFGEEVVVHPGDFILGDADGVVAIPVDKVEEAVKLCQERFDIDEKTREALENGDEFGPTIQRLRKWGIN